MTPLVDSLNQHDAFIDVGYVIDNQHHRINTKFDGLTVSDFNLAIHRKWTPIDQHTFELEYSIHLNETASMLKLHHFEVFFYSDLADNTMMAEGFQCWTQTKEMDRTSRLPKIQSAVAWVTKFDLQGDYNFYDYSGEQGVIHSTGYTYLRHLDDDSIMFMGSLSEDNGYSYFKCNFGAHRFSIYKDVQGKTLALGSEPYTMRYLITRHHDQNILWRRYADRLLPIIKKSSSLAPLDTKTLTGWTSWYNFYEAVTEKDVIDSLSGFTKHGYPVDLIQVDDGYERAIGDWLDVDSVKFPHGMKYLADEIKQRTKAMPGIWLAPFAVGLKSKLIKEHPEWLVYLPDGNPLLAGPNWGGFRALDIYHPEVRDYLQHVFDTVIDVWGYKFLKLDFLFAAAMIPRCGKTRGEIMWDSVTLINELTNGRALLLGSGITLPSVWGRMNYSRISSDASPWWDHSLLRVANTRERVSTFNALVSTLNRWPMSKVMFGNDPDVFFIRSNNNKLTADERYTLTTINNLLGEMALMSDNVDLYSSTEHDLYAKTFPKVRIAMQHMDRIGDNVYRLHYTCNGRPYITVTNLSSRPCQFLLPSTDAVYFEYENALLKNGNTKETTSVRWIDAKKKQPLLLRSHQTRTFMQIVDDFAGSTGHIIPGWEVQSIVKQGTHGDLAHLHLRQPRVQKSDIYFYFKSSTPTNDDNHTMAYAKTFINDKLSNDIQHLTARDDGVALFPMVKITFPPPI